MASFNKFNQFVQDLAEKVHNLSTDQVDIYLSNAAPDAAADLVKADLAEITNQNGYTAPVDTQNTGAEAGGTYTLTGTKVVVTATGAVGPFQYVVLINQTAASDPLIGYWNYGSAVTLANGETFTIKFNNSDTTGTILTIA